MNDLVTFRVVSMTNLVVVVRVVLVFEALQAQDEVHIKLHVGWKITFNFIYLFLIKGKL